VILHVLLDRVSLLFLFIGIFLSLVVSGATDCLQTRLQNDLLCYKQDVKLLNHSAICESVDLLNKLDWIGLDYLLGHLKSCLLYWRQNLCKILC